ncbi:extracellular solute-binding protein [Streptomyces sp. 4503]|uniref:Extracellular solute-binding protein n=1 Tax=Streptomyces niphimycinicus TaxID=2842201 RepID=A0ABS6CE57_9ACTN|nr:extracellular solute-binding protein [Streptomyces niphimycinicus]MBU3865065.1 extracellular solute-binding protein [Streptomyces niphimycinicus]
MRTTSRLRGITWDHPRGIDALRAGGDEFERATGIAIEWTVRSLQEFEDASVVELARTYDLVALDHPFIGDAVEAGALLPLETVFLSGELRERAADSAGPSDTSYLWKGQQWGGAVDAACMVSAHRAGAVDRTGIPTRWDAVPGFSRRHGREAVLLAANPTHLWGTVLSLCEAGTNTAVGPHDSRGRREDGRPKWWRDDGIDPEVLEEGIERVCRLLPLCAPESLASDPITVLERLSSPDDPALYCPLVFGYVTYARPGARAALVAFSDAPRIGEAPVGTLTGGVGLAVSAHSPAGRDAAAFVRFATSAQAQAGTSHDAGGQSGRRSVWADERVNADVTHFYRDTLDTMDRSFLRPRFPGYPAYQRAGADALHRGVGNGERPQEIAAELGRLWGKHVRV